MTVKLTPEKALDVRTLCTALLNKAHPTIRETAKVIGKIIATFPGVMYGPLYFRTLERDKTKALKANNWKFDKHLTLSNRAKVELQWWVDNIISSFNVIKREPPKPHAHHGRL